MMIKIVFVVADDAESETFLALLCVEFVFIPKVYVCIFTCRIHSIILEYNAIVTTNEVHYIDDMKTLNGMKTTNTSHDDK